MGRFGSGVARQTKPKKGPKRKVHEFRHFVRIPVFFFRKTSTKFPHREGPKIGKISFAGSLDKKTHPRTTHVSKALAGSFRPGVERVEKRRKKVENCCKKGVSDFNFFFGIFQVFSTPRPRSATGRPSCRGPSSTRQRQDVNIGKFCPLPLCTSIRNFRVYLCVYIYIYIFVAITSISRPKKVKTSIPNFIALKKNSLGVCFFSMFQFFVFFLICAFSCLRFSSFPLLLEFFEA